MACDASTGHTLTQLEHGVLALGVCGRTGMADVVGEVGDAMVVWAEHAGDACSLQPRQ